MWALFCFCLWTPKYPPLLTWVFFAMNVDKNGHFSTTYARLITYFGNFVFGFFVTLVAWFSVQGKTGKTKWKINKLLRNIFITSLPKTTKNQVTKMGWKQHYPPHLVHVVVERPLLFNTMVCFCNLSMLPNSGYVDWHGLVPVHLGGRQAFWPQYIY